MTKKILPAILAVVAASGSTNAATTIVITDANFGLTDTTAATADMGTIVRSGTAADTIYTISGVDVDEDGTDDVLTFQFLVTSNIADPVTFQDNGGGRYAPNLNDAGDNLTITIGAIGGTLSSGAALQTSATIDTVDFTQFQDGETYSVNADTLDGATVVTAGTARGGGAFDFADPRPTTTATVTNASGAFRVRDLGFTVEFDAVPEPSSLALLGLSFGLLARRRRA